MTTAELASKYSVSAVNIRDAIHASKDGTFRLPNIAATFRFAKSSKKAKSPYVITETPDPVPVAPSSELSPDMPRDYLQRCLTIAKIREAEAKTDKARRETEERLMSRVVFVVAQSHSCFKSLLSSLHLSHDDCETVRSELDAIGADMAELMPRMLDNSMTEEEIAGVVASRYADRTRGRHR